MSDAPDATTEVEEAAEPSALDEFAAHLAEKVGATGYDTEFDTVRIFVDRDNWVDTIVTASEDLPTVVLVDYGVGLDGVQYTIRAFVLTHDLGQRNQFFAARVPRRHG